jgi:UPF0755 protein
MPARNGPPARLEISGGRRPPRRGVVMRRRLLALAVVIVVAVALWFVLSLFEPFKGPGHGRVQVTLPKRATVGDIATILKQDDVISSTFFFKLRTSLDGDSGKLRAGYYRLKLGMSYGAALQALTTQSGLAPSVDVTIIPGRSRRQVQAALKRSDIKGNYVHATLKSKFIDPAQYGAPKHTPTLEGFLWPDTYNLRRPVKIADLIQEQLAAFKREIATVNLKYAKSKNLTAYDVLKIASLISEESFKPSDGPKVASVIYNRLRENMDLGLDSTVAYATNNYGTLTEHDLASKSRWNTTNHAGLPPTPIDSPDLAAIQYAAHPAKTNYIYFINRVCGNGALRFTANYSQFLKWSAAWNAAIAEAEKNHGNAEFCKNGKP